VGHQNPIARYRRTRHASPHLPPPEPHHLRRQQRTIRPFS
jgi:hypothetical protein